MRNQRGERKPQKSAIQYTHDICVKVKRDNVLQLVLHVILHRYCLPGSLLRQVGTIVDSWQWSAYILSRYKCTW
jgi:hypothetical protein